MTKQIKIIELLSRIYKDYWIIFIENVRNRSYFSKKLKITPSSGSLLKPFISGEWKSYAGTLCVQNYKNMFNIGYIKYWRKRENICFLVVWIILYKLWQNSHDIIVQPIQQSKLQKLIEAKMRRCFIIRTPLFLFPCVSLASHNCALSNFGFLAHV